MTSPGYGPALQSAPPASSGRDRRGRDADPPFTRRREPAGAEARAWASPEARRARLAALARLMDNAFEIPGLGVRFGLDAIVGLLPAAGDALGAGVSLYIVYEGWKLGATRRQLARMLANIGLDALLGAVPVLGDLADVGFKANIRNLRILGIDAGGTPRRR